MLIGSLQECVEPRGLGMANPLPPAHFAPRFSALALPA